MKSSTYQYPGLELDVFALAKNWKKYFSKFFRKELKGRVLEVGAGQGNNTLSIANDKSEWFALEPDKALFVKLNSKIDSQNKNRKIFALHGSLAALNSNEKFDSILYLDVLEHIADDKEELRLAATFLKTGGKLCIVSPAHPFLFSEFDRAIGHCRRYTRESLTEVIPPGFEKVRLIYLDSVGMLTSLFARYKKIKNPSASQILIWDRVIVPLSRCFDPLFGFQLGKSVLGIWKKK